MPEFIIPKQEADKAKRRIDRINQNVITGAKSLGVACGLELFRMISAFEINLSLLKDVKIRQNKHFFFAATSCAIARILSQIALSKVHHCTQSLVAEHVTVNDIQRALQTVEENNLLRKISGSTIFERFLNKKFAALSYNTVEDFLNAAIDLGKNNLPIFSLIFANYINLPIYLTYTVFRKTQINYSKEVAIKAKAKPSKDIKKRFGLNLDNIKKPFLYLKHFMKILTITIVPKIIKSTILFIPKIYLSFQIWLLNFEIAAAKKQWEKNEKLIKEYCSNNESSKLIDEPELIKQKFEENINNKRLGTLKELQLYTLSFISSLHGNFTMLFQVRKILNSNHNSTNKFVDILTNQILSPHSLFFNHINNVKSVLNMPAFFTWGINLFKVKNNQEKTYAYSHTDKISASNLNTSRRAKEPISLDITRGNLTAIKAPNGYGKSTLLKMLAQVITPDKGRIFLPSSWNRRYFVEQISDKIYRIAPYLKDSIPNIRKKVVSDKKEITKPLSRINENSNDSDHRNYQESFFRRVNNFHKDLLTNLYEIAEKSNKDFYQEQPDSPYTPYKKTESFENLILMLDDKEKTIRIPSYLFNEEEAKLINYNQQKILLYKKEFLKIELINYLISYPDRIKEIKQDIRFKTILELIKFDIDKEIAGNTLDGLNKKRKELNAKIEPLYKQILDLIDAKEKELIKEQGKLKEEKKNFPLFNKVGLIDIRGGNLNITVGELLKEFLTEDKSKFKQENFNQIWHMVEHIFDENGLKGILDRKVSNIAEKPDDKILSLGQKSVILMLNMLLLDKDCICIDESLSSLQQGLPNVFNNVLNDYAKGTGLFEDRPKGSFKKRFVVIVQHLPNQLEQQGITEEQRKGNTISLTPYGDTKKGKEAREESSKVKLK